LPRPYPELLQAAGKSAGLFPTTDGSPPEASSQQLPEVKESCGAAHLCDRFIYGRGPLPEARRPLAEDAAEPPVSSRGPPDDETIGFLRHFTSRARCRGALGLPRLTETLRAAAASGDGALTEEEFISVSRAQGLCTSYHECRKIFRHFAAAGGGVHVDALLAEARGSLQGGRAEAVREIWQKLDPEGRGFIEVRALLAAFDPRRLPAVCFDGVELEIAQTEFLEGLGLKLEGGGAQSRPACFALEEAAVGRRPRPAGLPGGGPLQAPAGQPGFSNARSHGDAAKELATRPPLVRDDDRITAEAFQAYYAALSVGIADDGVFKRTVRDPWSARRLHEEAMAMRYSLQGRRRKAPDGEVLAAPSFGS